jgi:hypothetical protein
MEIPASVVSFVECDISKNIFEHALLINVAVLCVHVHVQKDYKTNDTKKESERVFSKHMKYHNVCVNGFLWESQKGRDH